MTERRRITDMDTTLQRFVSISTVGVGLVTVLAFAGTIASFIADAKTNEILMPTSKVSTDNSHSTLITDGSNFTGAWEDVSQYDSVVVAVKTDQNGYFEIQFSPDGVEPRFNTH
jgi:hypothetical protein